MMNILVTGANGQLGQCLRDCVESIGHTDNSWFWTDVVDIPGREVQHLDITDEEAVRKFFVDNSISVCVNCAAYTNVDKAEDDQEMAKKLNADAPKILAEACKIHGTKLVHISTDYVFNGTAFIPLTEDRLTFPTSVYGKTKLEGEQNIINSGCKYLIFRTAWLYSEYGNNFVKTMMKLITEKKSFNVVNDQIGTPTYARNLAQFIWTIVDTNNLLKDGIYHFTDEGVASWYDFAVEIKKFIMTSPSFGIFSILAEIDPISTKEFYGEKKHANRPYYSVLNKGKVKTDFGWSFSHWSNGVYSCVQSLLQNDFLNKSIKK